MHFRGLRRAAAPDPARDMLEQARRMPVPIYGLASQRHVEDWDAVGVSTGTHDGTLDSCDVSISYTLWRNPEYIDDPVNFAQLDDDTRHQLDQDVPGEPPTAFLDRVWRTRYPLLWECVTTHWRAAPGRHGGVETELVAHVNRVVANSFRASRVRALHGTARAETRTGARTSAATGSETSLATRAGTVVGVLDSPVDERHVERNVPVLVGGSWRSGIRIDTDPDVYGVGVPLGETSCVTAVIPRDELRFIKLAFTTRRF